MSVRNVSFLVTILTLLSATSAQDKKDHDSLSPLTVEKIMRDPKWIGTSPRSITWSEDSQWIYFYWNPENTESESLYVVSRKGGMPRKVTLAERNKLPAQTGPTSTNISSSCSNKI